MQESLENCPFCNAAPRMIIRKGKDGWRDLYSVLCDYFNCGCGAESGWYHTEEEAAEAWNSRTHECWIPVTDRLPEINKEVLVFGVGNADGFWGDTVIAISKRYLFKLFPSSAGTEIWSDPWRYFNVDYKITHWRPLPDQPRGDSA